ncbi:MAG TPA: SdpI family protein [Longimicrobiales bacterium]
MNRRWLGFTFAFAALLFSAVVYDRLPDQIPTHFNLAGEPDDWTGRFWGAFLMPLLGMVMYGLFHLFPRISPRRANLDRFEDTYWLIANATLAFLSALHVLVLGRALGWPIDITSAILLGVGAMFMIIGNVLPRTRSNWWIGIRTPWTMESENVWRATHRLAGKTFMIGGAFTIIGALLPPDIRPWVAIGALAIGGFIPVIYSYLYWRRERAA